MIPTGNWFFLLPIKVHLLFTLWEVMISPSYEFLSIEKSSLSSLMESHHFLTSKLINIVHDIEFLHYVHHFFTSIVCHSFTNIIKAWWHLIDLNETMNQHYNNILIKTTYLRCLTRISNPKRMTNFEVKYQIKRKKFQQELSLSDFDLFFSERNQRNLLVWEVAIQELPSWSYNHRQKIQ